MKISFRYKIQMAVLGILTITLASYIYLASQTLQQEKLSSLYESAGSGSEVMANRVGKKLLTQEFWLESVLSESTDQVDHLNKNENLIAVWQKKNGNLETVMARNEQAKTVKPPEAGASGIAVALRPDQKNFWIVKSFSNGDVLYSLWSFDLFQDEIKNYPEAVLFLYDPQSQVVGVLNGSNASAISGSVRSLMFAQTMEAREVPLGQDNFVLGSTPIESTSVVMGVALPTALALEAAKKLQIRSIYFAIFVFGLTGLLSVWMGRALTQKLLMLSDATNRIAEGDLDSAKEVKSSDEVGDLSRDIVRMAQDLKKYIKEVAEKSRMEAELKTARTVQDTLFPDPSWSENNYQIYGHYECATECGGDLWFHWKINNYLFFIVADATGHGVPSALIISAARSIIAGVQHMKETQIATIIRLLHHAVHDSSKGKILMTAWLGKLDVNTGEVEYVNCSHEPAFHIQADGQVALIMSPNNPRVGDSYANGSFETGKLQLNEGEKLCLYTDGLSEIRNANGETYSERKFVKLLAGAITNNEIPQYAVDKVLEEMHEKFAGNAPLEDDLTLVMLSRAKA